MAGEELIHSVTAPRFRLVNPPMDLDVLPRSIDFSFDFTTQCTTYNWIPIDERGVTHKTEGGHILQYEPKYRLLFNLNWDWIKVAAVTGGSLPALSTSAKNEYEFLTYLMRYKHLFSYNGSAELYIILNHLSGATASWTSGGEPASPDERPTGYDDAEYRVVLLSAMPKKSSPAVIHGFDIQLETIDFVDPPYTMAFNHDASI